MSLRSSDRGRAAVSEDSYILDMVIHSTSRAIVRATMCLTVAMPVGQLKAQGAADTLAITSAVQSYINALESRDTAYIRTASLPQAISVAVSSPREAPIVSSVDAVIEGLSRQTRRFQGRVWSPRISIEGGIALFVAPYDAWYDGRFSHCGIDHYVLVRFGDRWLVSQLLYTRQSEGCAPSPLGPPR